MASAAASLLTVVGWGYLGYNYSAIKPTESNESLLPFNNCATYQRQPFLYLNSSGSNQDQPFLYLNNYGSKGYPYIEPAEGH